jgi:ATP-binding cassette subfamily F protein 3
MLLLSCKGITRGYDANWLFEDLSCEIHSGERIGLVGLNGAGKSTLMRILAGKDQPDSGEVRLHAGARVGLLEQHAEFAPGRTLYEEAKSALSEFLHAQEELIHTAEALAQAQSESERKALSARYDRLNELLAHHGAYSIDHRVGSVLEGLGFARADFDRECSTFSGGQQRRLLLAKLLLSGPDVMLLDEPSNHLDIDTTQWLEQYLVQQPQAMLIVSHDRYFLNKTVTKIFELHDRKITVYPGNYQQYWRLRQQRYEQQLKAYESQQEYIQKQEEYIRRVHYGQLARQAQSRRKALERLELVERPSTISAPRMHFGDVVRTGDVVFEVERLSKSFGSRVLFSDLSFSLPRGKRLGIMGPNGSGKTTLLKILLGEEPPTHGRVTRGHLVQVGYLDQQLQVVPDDKTVLEAVWPDPDPSITEQTMRDLLGRFGLSGEIVTQKVGSLSGGERSRAALARLVVMGVNVLILDEPTNHLDIWACDALEQAILEYEGTVIVVSHDRYFLNRIADLLIYIDQGKAELVHGNYETLELLRANRKAAQAEAAARQAAASPSASPGKSASPAPPPKRKRKFPYRPAVDLEEDIARQEALIKQLEEEIASPDFYRDAARMQAKLAEFEAAKQKLQQLYEHWEEACELN